jgi:hypothetical protein
LQPIQDGGFEGGFGGFWGHILFFLTYS